MNADRAQYLPSSSGLITTIMVMTLLFRDLSFDMVDTQDFVTSLSVLARGTIDEKLRWAFSLYDLNGDGVLSRPELTTIVTAIYSIMGKYAQPTIDRSTIRAHVDRIFEVYTCSLSKLLRSPPIGILQEHAKRTWRAQFESGGRLREA